MDFTAVLVHGYCAGLFMSNETVSHGSEGQWIGRLDDQRTSDAEDICFCLSHCPQVISSQVYDNYYYYYYYYYYQLTTNY